MPQRKQAVVKTDASTRNGDGSGLAYLLVVTDNNGINQEYRNKKYVERKLTTTEAETLATLYALRDMQTLFKDRDDYIKNYAIVIESDCEHTVRRVNGDASGDEKIDRFINYYKNLFGNVRARWIPRADNVQADSMAKTIFQRKTESND